MNENITKINFIPIIWVKGLKITAKIGPSMVVARCSPFTNPPHGKGLGGDRRNHAIKIVDLLEPYLYDDHYHYHSVAIVMVFINRLRAWTTLDKSLNM